MWSQYDENLDENPFFKLIQDDYDDLLEKVSEEHWIICVPRNGSYEPDKISIDTILDHILIPGTGHTYHTLSKKSLVLRNKRLLTENNACYNGDVEVLFEETFYVKKPARYTVWCIDRTLFLERHRCDTHRSVRLENLHDCVDFLWAESLGHNILDDIRELSDEFVREHEDIETEDLQTQKELIGKLFSRCLQVGFRNEFVREKSNGNAVFLDNFKLSIETFMQYSLGRKLMFCANTLQYQTDAFINKTLKNASELQYDDVGIPSKLFDITILAKIEISKINNYVTVLDKISCLKKTFSVIFQNKDVHITADEVLQILVFLILKLNINNWAANLTYLKEFNFSLLDPSDQNSFFITSLEAALEFIKSNHFLEIKPKCDTTDHTYQVVNKINDLLKTNEQCILPNLMTNITSNSEKKLCHPLCSCEKCKDILNHKTNEQPHNPNICNDKSQNLLIVASLLGHIKVIEFLVGKGFNVNSSDCFNKSALHYAATKGFQDILLFLVTHKANVNAVDNYKNTPLHLACQNGQENCVKALIYSSADLEINIENHFGDTPLHVATKWGYFDIIKVLLENGASVVIKNKRKQTVLNLAPNYHIYKLFQHFGMERSTTILKQIKDKELSSVREDKVYSDQCKEHGIRPKNVEQYKKIDLLLKAIENNDLPLTCFYLGFSSIGYKCSDNPACHPLCNCENCTSSDTENSSTSNLKNININMCNVNGLTPLHVAAKYGRTEILRSLLDSGALPNVKTYKTLYTPLHLACIFQRIQIVRELLKCGECKVDEYDVDGNTPLFHACEKNDTKIVELLICNGADCNKKNCAGKSPLQQSQESMQYRLFKIMKNSLINNIFNNSFKESLENLLE